MVKDGSLADPSAWGCTLHRARLNGIMMRWADTALSDEERRLPLVLLVHGWPESWFSWRHQLKALGGAGFRGVAPDMRGYGGTEAPRDPSAYTVNHLSADLLALLRHLGVRRAALVGHDHGANLGWQLAALYPQVFTCYMALSVPPYSRGVRGNNPPIELARKMFGDERLPETNPKYFYQLHHQLPDAAEAYAAGTREVFMALFGDLKGPRDPPPISSDRLYVDGKPEPMWRRLPAPQRLAPWITQTEFDYFVEEFNQHGWNGGLNWYRVMDDNYALLAEVDGVACQQPVCFIAGTKDMVISMAGGVEKTEVLVRKHCPQNPRILFVDGAGHWIQQECAEFVNQELLRFVGDNRDLFRSFVEVNSKL
eukprot:TRINITY_DN61006_c0_g1_i1.p1 TRINITY_DN61006_c0_g1~~TRINITY_DN61006_c0_g1_i1.p1  ORF type:complete len:367 (+),score=58.09 TRINITY_DN61006_c0_g1_i1:99-1199(+)